jgi:hypothetical protein
LAFLGVLAVNPSARADDGGLLHDLARELRARIDTAIAARGPKLAPPVPIDVKWNARRVGTLDLGGPLVALAAADLDGDRKAELYAVTPHEVIAIALERRPKELARVAFAGEPAVQAPRDVVGTAVVDGGAVVASVSTHARGLRVHWKGKTLVADPGDAGFELCAGERVELAPGRNYFGDGTYATRCRDDLVDPSGRALHVRGHVTVADKLEVAIETCDAAACAKTAHHELGNAGVAFELADIDRDGRPEAIYAAAGAPGDPDHVKVVTLGDDPKKPLFRREWSGGVVGIVAADVDGDGRPCVIVAVRLAGSTRVDLWRLN